MADSSLLASILSGTDPLAPLMLSAYQGSQLGDAALNPNFGHNEGIGGALAKIIAGFRGGAMTSDAVNSLTAARDAARPELAQVMATDDPFKTVGANPGGYSQQTLAAVLSGATPGSVAEARLKGAQAATAALNLRGYQTMSQQPTTAVPPVKNAGALMGAGSPSTSPRSSPGPDISSLTSGRPAPLPDMDPGSLAAMSAPQRAAAIARMNQQQRATYAARLRAQLGGGANAPGP